MKKVLFLMFLLLLIGLGAAGVKAQVRIGGNAAPNAAAVLDLNATDATNSGTKTLALPRVSLTSATDLLSNTTLLTGMLVYNTGGSLSAGVYYWDGSKWTGIAGGYDIPGVIDTIRGNNGTYRVYCFPAATGLGCWMVDNTREGTSSATTWGNTTIGPVGYYYTNTQAIGACPAGYHLPASADWKALGSYLNHTSDITARLFWTTNPSLAGNYDGTLASWNFFGTMGVWWGSTSPNVTTMALGVMNTSFSWPAPSYLATVRCMHY